MRAARVFILGVVFAALLAAFVPAPSAGASTASAASSGVAAAHGTKHATSLAEKSKKKKKHKKKKSSKKQKHKSKKKHKKKKSSKKKKATPPPVVQSCDAHWRGYVKPSDHNYAGIGAYNGSDRYMCKPTAWQGVRAQIQHLRNYADAGSRSWNLGAPFEPRVKYDAPAFDSFPLKGSAPRWKDLEGRWAVPGTTYWDTIKSIYNSMRKFNGLSTVSDSYSITGSSSLSASQIASYVNAVGNPWKPEIGPRDLAQLYLSEGNAAGVRGDVAFCQSILETGWFGWPASAAAAVQAESAPDTTTTTSTTTTSTTSTTSTTTTTTTTTPGSTPDSTLDTTTTSTTSGVSAASPTSTTTSTTTTTVPPEVIDPVLAAYFELMATTTARN